MCALFPSALFAEDTCFNCHINNAETTGEYIEFYPLDALINFLFSPVGRECTAGKLAVLERMQRYYRSSIHRRLYFMPQHLHSRIKDPCMRVVPQQGQVAFLFPNDTGDVSVVEVNNSAFAATLHKHYYQSIALVQDGLNLLDIAHRTLSMQHGDERWADLRYFYRQCVLRTSCAAWVKSCFSPDVQAMLGDAPDHW